MYMQEVLKNQKHLPTAGNVLIYCSINKQYEEGVQKRKKKVLLDDEVKRIFTIP